MFDRATYAAAELMLDPGDLLVAYSDGVTEAEDPAGAPFDESGLRRLIEAHHRDAPDDLGAAIVAAVVAHAASGRLADDLTVLAARRLPPARLAGQESAPQDGADSGRIGLGAERSRKAAVGGLE